MAIQPHSPDDGDQLQIHLDLDGLAGLLRAIEAALATGQGHLTSESAGGRGIFISSGSSQTFDQVTLAFSRPRSAE